MRQNTDRRVFRNAFATAKFQVQAHVPEFSPHQEMGIVNPTVFLIRIADSLSSTVLSLKACEPDVRETLSASNGRPVLSDTHFY
jgi:hypothetical protein